MASILGNLASQIQQTGSEMRENAGAIQAKNDQIDSLKDGSKPEPTGPSAGKPAKTDMVKGGRFGSRPGEQRINTAGMVKPLGSFHKGGRVKKTGVYMLKKGEHVLNDRQTAQMDMAEKSGAWHSLSGMDAMKK